MSQLFTPRSNIISKISILVILIVLGAIGGGVELYLHSSAFTKVGVQVPQPVPFPHSTHINALGMNCRYCHAGVDQTSFADIPSAETCMTCHSVIAINAPDLQPVRDSYANGTPIQWNRVNSLPDYVYFNHQIHVAKGVGCETCHGRMDQEITAVRAVYFTMAACTECHRDPASYLRPQANIYDMGYVPSENQASLGPKLLAQYNIMSPTQLINCSICHR